MQYWSSTAQETFSCSTEMQQFGRQIPPAKVLRRHTCLNPATSSCTMAPTSLYGRAFLTLQILSSQTNLSQLQWSSHPPHLRMVVTTLSRCCSSLLPSALDSSTTCPTLTSPRCSLMPTTPTGLDPIYQT